MNTRSASPARPSAATILAVYGLVTLAAATNWGRFSWDGLALIVAANALMVWMHLRPLRVGASVETYTPLFALLIASLAIASVMSIGQGLTVIRDRHEAGGDTQVLLRYAAPGMAMRFVLLAALAAAATYAIRADAGRWTRARFPLLLALALALRVLMLVAVPDPRIDVFVLQQKGAKALVEGRNPYTQDFPSPDKPGRTFSQYCYPPPTALVNVAAWGLFKDVRAGWLILDLAAGLLLYAAARRMRPDARETAELAALAFLFGPRSLLVIEKAWTEPLAAAAMGALALALARGRAGTWAGAAAAVLLSAKQYAVMALPALWRAARWPGRAVLAGAIAIALLWGPFVVAEPRALYGDLVGFFLGSSARPDALSLYGALAQRGHQMPWSLVAGLWAAGALFFAARMRRDAAGFALAAAGTWLWFFLFGKQAFMNYFYLIGYALLLAAALTPPERSDGSATP